MLVYNLKAVAKKLEIDFKEITSKIEHPAEMGTAREEILKSYLSQFLPVKYTVGNGFVVDSDNNKSKQQDFIIYDAFNSPMMLKMQSLQIVPIESVYCTIEIKSTLTKGELEKCVKNIKSVRELKRSTITTRVLHLGIEETIGCVFAYTSDLSLETLQKHLIEINKDIPKNEQISFICVLDKGLIYNVDIDGMTGVQLYPNENTELVRSEKELDDNLSVFYLFVLEHLNRCDLLPPNLIKYASKQGGFSVKPNLNVNDLSDNGSIDTIIGKISKQDIKQVYNLCKDINPIFDKKINTKEDFIETLINLKSFEALSVDNTLRFNNNFSIDFGVIETIGNLKREIDNKTITDEKRENYNKLIDSLYNEYNEKELNQIS